jgi:uncharacterized protein
MSTRGNSPREVVEALVETVADVIRGNDRRVDELVALYADPTHVVHPLGADRSATVTRPDELRLHFAPGKEDMPIRDFRVSGLRMHATDDPEVVVAEFAYEAAGLTAPCIFVTRVRDGRILESRDYVDHATMAALLSAGQRGDDAEGSVESVSQTVMARNTTPPR